MSTNQLGDVVAPIDIAVPPAFTVSHDVLAAADRLGVGRYLPEVIEFTIEIFGNFSDLRVVPDPEVTDELRIIFKVPVTGSVDDILEKDMRWARRLHAAIPRAPRVFSIAMDYQE